MDREPGPESKIAFAADRDGRMNLWIHDFKTNEDSQLTKDGGVSGPAWSPDGMHIAYVLDGREVVFAVRPDGRAREAQGARPSAPLNQDRA